MAWGHASASALTRTGVGGSGQINMGFVPEIWTGRMLKALDDKLVTGKLVNRDYEGEIKGAGDTVRIHMIGNVNVKDYVVAATRGVTPTLRQDEIVYQTVTGASTTMSIDKADYFAFEVEDIETAQANPKYMAELSARAGVALAQSTERYIIDKMLTAAKNGTADDFGQVGGTSALTNDVHLIDDATAGDFYDHLVELAIMFDDNLAPEQGRWVVAPSFILGNLLKDTRFVGAGAAGAQGMRDNGKIGRIAGFDVYTLSRKTFQDYDAGNQNTQVPNDTATDDDTNNPDMWTGTDNSDDLYDGIAGVKEAFTFADQITKTETVRLEGAFANGVRGLHVYGGKALRPQWLYAVRFQENAIQTGSVNPQA